MTDETLGVILTTVKEKIAQTPVPEVFAFQTPGGGARQARSKVEMKAVGRGDLDESRSPSPSPSPKAHSLLGKSRSNTRHGISG